MDKIIEALSKLLPEDQVKGVAEAVEAMLNDAKAELEAEYNSKLEEAYGELSTELKEGEKVAEEGYKEAMSIIEDLRNRIETQRVEFETALEEGYEEAYQMLLAEKGKNESLEAELIEQYDKKLSEMREYMIDKVDEFLQYKGQDIYEKARRDVLNDPRMVEHKVALDRVVETLTDYISDEDYALANSGKIEETLKAVEELKGQVRILEARNIRLSNENVKLTETVRKSGEVLKEQQEVAAQTEKKERVKKAESVQGRGRQVTENIEVIKETQDVKTETQEEAPEDLAGSLNEWQVLSGIKKSS